VTFDRYTDEQWEAIVAARADWPPGIKWAGVRADLERHGRAHHSRRASRPADPQREFRSLLKKLQHIKALEAASDLPERAAAELKLWRRRLEGEEMSLSLYCSKAFRGRSDLSRSVLFARVLVVWTERLGGKLQVSRDSYHGKVGGPAVRFLIAVLKPILGPEAPTPEGMAAIIKREAAGKKSYIDALVDWRMRYGES
jgi:hypothetical protein